MVSSLRCAPPTCIVRHRAALCTMHKGDEHANQGSQCSSAQCTFVPIRWCTRHVCMFVIKFFWMACLSVCLSVTRQKLLDNMHHQPTNPTNQPVLCTTDLHCAPWCTRGTYVHQKWGSPSTFLIFLAHLC